MKHIDILGSEISSEISSAPATIASYQTTSPTNKARDAGEHISGTTFGPTTLFGTHESTPASPVASPIRKAEKKKKSKGGGRRRSNRI